MFQFLKALFGFGPSVDYKNLVSNGAIIIDVRTAEEYKSGHINGSLNIPLDRIAASVSTLKSKNAPIIAVCRSGARSGAAVGILKNSGLEAYNGGSWNGLQAQLA